MRARTVQPSQDGRAETGMETSPGSRPGISKATVRRACEEIQLATAAAAPTLARGPTARRLISRGWSAYTRRGTRRNTHSLADRPTICASIAEVLESNCPMNSAGISCGPTGRPDARSATANVNHRVPTLHRIEGYMYGAGWDHIHSTHPVASRDDGNTVAPSACSSHTRDMTSSSLKNEVAEWAHRVCHRSTQARVERLRFFLGGRLNSSLLQALTLPCRLVRTRGGERLASPDRSEARHRLEAIAKGRASAIRASAHLARGTASDTTHPSTFKLPAQPRQRRAARDVASRGPRHAINVLKALHHDCRCGRSTSAASYTGMRNATAVVSASFASSSSAT